MARTYTVYTVLFDGAGEGPAADGTHVARFSRRENADAFARGKTTWGHPCEVQVDHDVPARLARRWGVA